MDHSLEAVAVRLEQSAQGTFISGCRTPNLLTSPGFTPSLSSCIPYRVRSLADRLYGPAVFSSEGEPLRGARIDEPRTDDPRIAEVLLKCDRGFG